MTEFLYILFLLEVLLIAKVCSLNGVFNNFFASIQNTVKSRRLSLLLLSAFSGVLPIQGRIVVSTGILSSGFAYGNRAKLGIVNYLATHHYYLWSPLEKTVLIPMTVLGLSYTMWLNIFIPYIILSFAFLGAYVCLALNPDEIALEQQPKSDYSPLHVVPLLASIGLMIYGVEAAYIFGACLSYYMTITKSTPSLALLRSAIPITVVVAVLVSMGLSSVVSTHFIAIKEFLTNSLFDIDSIRGFIYLTISLFTASFVLGSSGKFAGITAVCSSIYGLSWLPYIFLVEFLGYNLSPTHKCTVLSTTYFKIPIRQYVLVVGLWSTLLLVASLILKFNF